MNRISARELEARLQAAGVPYVAVDEARKTLFAGVSMSSFHFVVYREDGPNWLVSCRPFSRPGWRETMKKWQDLFGDGFLAVEARKRQRLPYPRIVMVALDGNETVFRFKDYVGANVDQSDATAATSFKAAGL